MKDSLITLIKYLKGNNSIVEEAENEINDLEHKETKKHYTNQNNKKEKEF